MFKIFAATSLAFLVRAVSGFAHDELSHAELRQLLDQATIHQNFGEDIAHHIPSAIRAELAATRPETVLSLEKTKPEQTDISKKNEDECACKECVMKGARFIVGMAKKKIDAWCDDKKDWAAEFDKCEGRDCKKKMWCKFWNDKPEVALGLVIEKMRPVSDAFFWCMGHGECKKGNDVSEALMPAPDKCVGSGTYIDFPVESAVSEEFRDFEVEDMLYEGGNPEDDDDDDHFRPHHRGPYHNRGFFGRILDWFRSWFHRGPPPPRDEDEDYSSEELSESAKAVTLAMDAPNKDFEVTVPKMKGVCPKCYKRVFRFVVMAAIKGTKKMCASTKCPYLKGWCKWAGEHKGMAVGIIIGKVEPWKYALGRCWHKGGRRGGHHGHHHGSPPPPHGHDGPPPPPPHHRGGHHGHHKKHHHHHHHPHHDDDNHDDKNDEDVPAKFIEQWEKLVSIEEYPVKYGSFKSDGDKNEIVDSFKFLEHQSEHKKKHKYPSFWTLGDKSGKNGYKVCGKTGNLVHMKWPKIFASLNAQGCFVWSHGYTSCPVSRTIVEKTQAVQGEEEPVLEVYI